jgi:HEAT repeat protein
VTIVAPPPKLTAQAAMQALSDPDPVIRGVAAITLRDAGTAAYPALDNLIAKLKDPDENVRLMSAEAIARQGKRAARAVPELIAACEAPGQHVHVLRSAAGALGAIGPEAAPALPVLRKLEAIPRVRWAAKAAIRQIE